MGFAVQDGKKKDPSKLDSEASAAGNEKDTNVARGQSVGALKTLEKKVTKVPSPSLQCWPRCWPYKRSSFVLYG